MAISEFCWAFHMKMSFICHFHNNCLALRLALKQRHKGTALSEIPNFLFFFFIISILSYRTTLVLTIPKTPFVPHSTVVR